VTILHIDTSINGENSVSRQVSRSIVDQIQKAQWGEAVIHRDLAASPLPHLTLDQFADTSVLDEFLAADTVVIGAPMYNFSIPSQLKAWIDRIVISGTTFSYGANGPEGLVGDKRVIIALARGNFYDEGSPAAPLEHVETYLRGVFAFIGITPEFVRADGIGLSPEHREKALESALVEVELLAA
jgi:FMN-dependent NADH-azoreductase